MDGNRRLLIVSVGLRKRLILQSGVIESLFPAQQVCQVANANDYECSVFIGPLLQLWIVSLFAHQ